MNKITDDEIESICMNIIANSGDARSKAYLALEFAKRGEFEKANEMMKNANDVMNVAHGFHSKALQYGATGELEQETILLAHAQDHVMSTMTIVDMMAELINLYKVIKDK